MHRKAPAILLCGALIIASTTRDLSHLREPGGRRGDASVALNNPDEYAWRLFFFLNHQAKRGLAGRPDPKRNFGELDPGAPVVWETWALESGGVDTSEVFKRNGARPVPWKDLSRANNPLILDINVEAEMIDQERQDEESRRSPKELFSPEQEIRMNRATFEFVVDSEMYNVQGLKAILARARQTGNRSLISLPPGSKEVKAEWLPIEDSQKTRYFWREMAGPGGSRQAYGLVALHVITKDLPNWFWADFGHVDCESGKSACAKKPAAETRPVDSTTRGPNGTPGPGSSGLNGVRRETEGTVWANYILRGTQTNFTTATGRPTILSNPVIEKIQKSSCITCHSRATVGNTELAGGLAYIGTPRQEWFGDDSDPLHPNIEHLQTDFMWTLAQVK